MDCAIGLRKFQMEEYPPKLMLIDSAGRGLPLKRPWQYSIETTPATTQYADWQFSVLEHLPFGAPVVSKDSIHFVQYGTKGAAHGVKVHARNLKTGKECEGWITAGSYLIPHRGLELDSATTLVMPQLEAKQYRSEVFVIAPDGTKEEASRGGTFTNSTTTKKKGGGAIPQFLNLCETHGYRLSTLVLP